MNDISLILLFLFSGYLTGILIGMLGIGGGLVFVPLLYILLPFTIIDKTQISYIVIATSLFAAVFGTLGSAGKHFISKNIEVRKAILLASGSVLSAFISPLFAVKFSPHTLQIIFAVIFTFISIKMLLENGGYNLSFKNPLNDFYLLILGLLIGVVTGFAGIGGGIIFVPVLTYLFVVDFKKAIGTSSLVTVFTTVVSALSYALISPKGFVVSNQVGYIYLFSGIPLGLGSAVGALTGAKFMLASSSGTLKKIFSVLLIIVVIKIIFDL